MQMFEIYVTENVSNDFKQKTSLVRLELGVNLICRYKMVIE